MKQLVLNIPDKDYPEIVNYIQSHFENIEIDIKKGKKQKKTNLALKYRGKVPKEIGLDMNEQYDKIRKEWERDI